MVQAQRKNREEKGDGWLSFKAGTDAGNSPELTDRTITDFVAHVMSGLSTSFDVLKVLAPHEFDMSTGDLRRRSGTFWVHLKEVSPPEEPIAPSPKVKSRQAPQVLTLLWEMCRQPEYLIMNRLAHRVVSLAGVMFHRQGPKNTEDYREIYFEPTFGVRGARGHTPSPHVRATTSSAAVGTTPRRSSAMGSAGAVAAGTRSTRVARTTRPRTGP